MEKVECCIFDVDGLLLDTERYVWIRGLKTIGKQMGVEITDEWLSKMIGSNFVVYAQKLKEKFGQDFPSDVFLDRLFKFYEDTCKNDIVPPRPGAIELLKFLKENNIKISIGTSSKRYFATTTLTNAGIYEYLDYSVFGDEVKNGKPDPEIYLKSAEHFGFKPENCIVFEDSPNGAKAAYNANINLVFVKDLIEPTELEHEKAFMILNRLDEIIPTIKEINHID